MVSIPTKLSSVQICGVGLSRHSKHSALSRAQAAHSSSASQLPAPGLVSICAQCATRFLLAGISSEAFITNPLPGWVFAHHCCAQAPHFSSCILDHRPSLVYVLYKVILNDTDAFKLVHLEILRPLEISKGCFEPFKLYLTYSCCSLTNGC